MRDETILRKMLTHPKRWWGVLIGSFGILLLFGLPLSDKYNELSGQRAELESALAQGKSLTQRAALYQKQTEKKKVELHGLEVQAISLEQVQRFRNAIVDLARDTGCTMRRIKLAEPSKRDWFEVDQPLQNRPHSDKEQKSPFKLQTQQLTVQVTGPLASISELLGKLMGMERMYEMSNFVLRRSTEDQNLVELDLELQLFDLVKSETSEI
jgi:hypothetical protein